MRDQFTPKRMAGLGLAFLLMFAFIVYMQAGIGTANGPTPPSGEDWNAYAGEAVLFTVFVILADAAVIMATLRRQKRGQIGHGGRS